MHTLRYQRFYVMSDFIFLSRKLLNEKIVYIYTKLQKGVATKQNHGTLSQ